MISPNCLKQLSVTLISLVLIACGDTPPIDSRQVSTSNMYADIHLTTSDDVLAIVEVQLKNGGANSNQEVRLSGGDTLSATTITNLDSLALQGDLFGNIDALADDYRFLAENDNSFDILGVDFISPTLVWYSAALSIRDTKTITVAFNRPGGDYVSAANSVATFPAAFEITQPVAANGTLYSRSLDEIVVDWNPSASSDFITIKAETQCPNDASNHEWTATDLADNGSYTIPAAALEAGFVSGECPALITVTKIKLGSIDPNYGLGGYITARQLRSVLVASTD